MKRTYCSPTPRIILATGAMLFLALLPGTGARADNWHLVARENAYKCIGKARPDLENGNPVHLWDCSTADGTQASDDQNWYLYGDGTIRHGNANGAKCLRKANPDCANGNPIHVWDCDVSGVPRTWTWEWANGQIRSQACPGKCIHKMHDSWDNGNRLHLWDCDAGPAGNRTWVAKTQSQLLADQQGGTTPPPPPPPLPPTTPPNGWVYNTPVFIEVNGLPGVPPCFHVDNSDEGTPVLLQGCAGVSAKKWVLEPVTDGPANSFYIKLDANRNLCVQRKDPDWQNGNPIHLSNCAAGSAESKTWVFRDNDGTSFQLAAAYNQQMCLRRQFDHWNDGNPLQLLACDSTAVANERWVLSVGGGGGSKYYMLVPR